MYLCPPMESLSAKIEQLFKELSRLDLLTRRVNNLKEDLKQVDKNLHALSIRVNKEKSDVDRLENASLPFLFRSILGNREQQLEIERQEYLQIVLQYNAAIDRREILLFELNVLEQKIAQVEDSRKDLDDLMQQKEKLLLKDYPVISGSLKRLDHKIQLQTLKLNEIDEAIREGDQCQKLATTIIAELQKVKKWGQYTMHGRGRYSSYSKKAFVDTAAENANRLQQYLCSFEEELMDVYKKQDFNLDDVLQVSEFNKFLKKFYDNMITDWIVRKGLSNTIHQMETIWSKSARILKMLRTEKRKILKEIKAYQQEKKELIVTS